jgi:hypothetical protein
MTRTEELPADLAERLQRLAETQTAGSQPWPRVEQSVRRAQRRRLTGVSAVALASALVAAVAFGGVLNRPARSDPSSAARKLQLHGLSQLRELGYAGPTGGGLAGDQSWLKQLRRRVQDLADAEDAGQHQPPSLGSANDVLVPWADDLNGSRLALAVYPSAKPADTGRGLEQFFTVALLTGPAGADADRLTVEQSVTMPSDLGAEEISAARVMTSATLNAGARYPAVEVVVAPRTTRVEVATTRTFTADGKIHTGWRALPRGSSLVWVGPLSPAENYLADLRVTGPDGVRSVSPGGSDPIPSQAAAIAPPGTNVGAVGCAGSVVKTLGASIAEQPVIARSTRLTRTLVLGATVLRSPNGVYLTGVCVGRTKPGGYELQETTAEATIGPGTADAAGFMAAVERDPTSAGEGPAYVVLAPDGATTVAIGNDTVPVHDRLAAFPRRAGRSGQVTVRALDAEGNVISTVTSREGR